jgi:polyvinyl alcohol dehydrogenase (cytochrome)
MVPQHLLFTSVLFTLLLLSNHQQQVQAQSFPTDQQQEDGKSLFPGQTFYNAVGGFRNTDRDWSAQGRNIFNDRNVTVSQLSSTTLNLASPTYRVLTNASTSATPAIFSNAFIYPSWDGKLRANHRQTGKLLWEVDIGMAYYNASVPGTKISRTTPSLYDRRHIVIGTMLPADLLLVDISNGLLVWKLNLDEHNQSAVTTSGVVWGNDYYVGVSSLEETAASTNQTYVCCTFVGSAVKVDLSYGGIVWQNYTISKNISGVGNFSGAPIWGSSPSLWIEKKIVFFATGNNYAAPSGYSSCLMVNSSSYCNNLYLYGGYNHANSVLALDTDTGSILWAFSASAYNAWNLTCSSRGPNCPNNPGSNYDFGMAPTLSTWCGENPNFQYSDSVNSVELPRGCSPALYVGQKSGALYALVPETGELIWSNQTSPGGTLGGLHWGIASDNERIYVAVSNSDGANWLLTNSTTVRCGGWGAFNKITGHAEWRISNPACWDSSSNGRRTSSFANGPPLSVNDIVLVTSSDTRYVNNTPVPGAGGWVYALNKTNGAILSSFETKASVYGGFSADNKCAYVGSGYRPLFGSSVGDSVYGWCVDD